MSADDISDIFGMFTSGFQVMFDMDLDNMFLLRKTYLLAYLYPFVY